MVAPMAPSASPPTAWALHSVRRPDNGVELRPSGTLDAVTARFLDARLDALIRSGYDEIVVDLTSVDRLDRVGSEPIERAAAVLDALGGRLTVLDPHGELAA